MAEYFKKILMNLYQLKIIIVYYGIENFWGMQRIDFPNSEVFIKILFICI